VFSSVAAADTTKSRLVVYLFRENFNVTELLNEVKATALFQIYLQFEVFDHHKSEE